MDIILTSDLHGNLPDMSQYSGDMLIIAGDICPNFKWNRFDDRMHQLNWLTQIFLPWCATIKVNHILICGSNHDFCFQDTIKDAKDILNYDSRIEILIDKPTLIGDKRAYFTPWIPYMEYWAYTANPEKMKLYREVIPNNIQILISHCPPYGILDEVNHYGCKILLDRIQQLPKLEQVWFGHCHEDGGKEVEIGGIKYINLSNSIKKIKI